MAPIEDEPKERVECIGLIEKHYKQRRQLIDEYPPPSIGIVIATRRRQPPSKGAAAAKRLFTANRTIIDNKYIVEKKEL